MVGFEGPNPFSPAFGSTPPLLAGREAVFDRFAEAAQAGPSHPDYTLLLTGERGSGKTALLNALEADASARGWPVITVASASEPAAARIARAADGLLTQARNSGSARLASLSVLGVGVAWERRAGADHGSLDLASTLPTPAALCSSRSAQHRETSVQMLSPKPSTPCWATRT